MTSYREDVCSKIELLFEYMEIFTPIANLYDSMIVNKPHGLVLSINVIRGKLSNHSISVVTTTAESRTRRTR
jgi:hypothetical protein